MVYTTQVWPIYKVHFNRENFESGDWFRALRLKRYSLQNMEYRVIVYMQERLSAWLSW